MKSLNKLAIIFLLTNSGNLWSQDLLPSTGGTTQQIAPSISTGKMSNMAPLSSGTNSIANSIQNSTKGQIGVNAQLNNGNVNSPTKETEDSSLINKEIGTIIEEKNQLQMFIAQTTGKDLELYGHSLFRKSNFSPVLQTPAPANYLIGPGDEIDVKIWGSIESNIRQIVDRDGRITLPQVGSFGISGTKVENLDETLKKQIGRIFKGFEVSGTLSKIRNIQIYVVGNAKKPGAYTVSGMSTLISAIFEANGPSQNGTMRRIRLIREGKEISQVDLYDFIKNGDNSGNVKLLSGDVIQFPSVGTRVGLLGAIDGQAIYELKDKNDSLGWLMNFVGETNTLVTPKKVLIERIDGSDKMANRSVVEKSLTEEGQNFILKDGDLINLYKINHQYANAVTLKGVGSTSFRFQYKEGMKISNLLPEPEALIQQDYFARKNMDVIQEEALGSAVGKTKQNVSNTFNEVNWSYAVIERLDRKEVKLNLIPFSLEKAIKEKDTKHDLLLMPGDTVVVFNNKDIQIPQSKKSIFVKISGEINAPGLYQVTQGEKLKELIDRSNGLTKDAYIYGTIFTRDNIKKLQQENLTKALNRLESDINSQTVMSVQNSTNQEMMIANQQQLASQKAFLNKLKTVQASGRISLELNPEDPKYPDVLLEDGDEIYIPNKPSFVGIFGSVYTESTFVYRPNTTAKDYLSKAGLARESDANAVMIIRADASIDSDNKNSGFFSKSVMDMKLYPGDTIFVPEAFDRRTSYTQFMQGAKDWTTILYQFGIGAAAWKTLKN